MESLSWIAEFYFGSNSVVFMTIRKQFGESEVKQLIQSKIKMQLIQPSGN